VYRNYGAHKRRNHPPALCRDHPEGRAVEVSGKDSGIPKESRKGASKTLGEKDSDREAESMNPSEETALRYIMQDIPCPTIVELGAHTGEDAPFLESLGVGQGLHVMVEADSKNADRIAPTPLRRIFTAAIGGKSELRGFHICEGATGSGSILAPTGHLTTFPTITFPKTISVACYTLDWLFKHLALEKIDLLYVDIQGAEGEMIAGGAKALARTRYLFIEAEEQEFYKGQLLRPELLSKLVGWTLIGEFPEANVHLRNENYVLPK
jgi:FkbM family methyltransferase